MLIVGIIKNLIKNDRYEYEDMMNKIDVYYMVNRFDEETYLELVELLNNKEAGKED